MDADSYGPLQRRDLQSWAALWIGTANNMHMVGFNPNHIPEGVKSLVLDGEEYEVSRYCPNCAEPMGAAWGRQCPVCHGPMQNAIRRPLGHDWKGADG